MKGFESSKEKYSINIVRYIEWSSLHLGVGDVCFFLTMRCFPILNDAMFWTMFFNF